MSSAKSLFDSFFVFIFLLIFAIIVDFSIGHAIDVTTAWDSSWELRTFVTNFHLFIYVIPAIGLGQFLYTAIRKQRYDVYTPEEAYYT
jgi:ABC-type dipeptide/oligopeptide/nickel transport system permease component